MSAPASTGNSSENHNMNYGRPTGEAETSPLYRRLAREWLISFDSRHTELAYARGADAYFEWCSDCGIDPLAATAVNADEYRRHLARRYSNEATVAQALAVCSSFYKFLRERHPDLGLDNPFAGTRRPKVSKESVMRGLTLPQAALLFDHAEACGPREAVMVHLLLNTGMRVSELVGAHTWDIRREGDHHTISIVRKGKKRGRVPLPPETVAAIHSYVGKRTGLVLVNRHDGPVSRHQVSRDLDRMAKQLALPTLTPHRLRHTAATIAIENGQTVEQVQEMLGHVDITTTMRYFHASRSVERSAVHGLAAAYRRARAELPTTPLAD